MKDAVETAADQDTLDLALGKTIRRLPQGELLMHNFDGTWSTMLTNTRWATPEEALSYIYPSIMEDI